MPAGYKTHDPARWADKHHAGMMFVGVLPWISIEHDELRRCFDNAGARVAKFMPQISCARVIVPEQNELTLATALAETGLIRYVEPIFAQSKWATTTPNDPQLSSQSHLVTINATSAWDYTQGSANIIIAHCDSGIDLSHPDVSTSIVAPWNYVNNNSNAQDVFGHGTETSGVICAATNNGVGIAGIAWNCPIMPLVVDLNNGTQIDIFLTEAILYAVTNGASVITMSFSSYGFSQAEQDACNHAAAAGLILFAAGGNDSFNFLPYPALYNNVISVTACNSAGVIDGYNNHGTKCLLAAQGDSIFTTGLGGGYGNVNGSSFACPVAAGVAALVRSVTPYIGPAEVFSIMLANTLPVSGGTGQPNLVGMVNAGPAVLAAQHRLQSAFWIKH